MKKDGCGNVTTTTPSAATHRLSETASASSVGTSIRTMWDMTRSNVWDFTVGPKGEVSGSTR